MCFSDRTGGELPPTAYKLVFGAASGVVSQLACYPMDIVRRRIQTAGSPLNLRRVITSFHGIRNVVDRDRRCGRNLRSKLDTVIDVLSANHAYLKTLCKEQTRLTAKSVTDVRRTGEVKVPPNPTLLLFFWGGRGMPVLLAKFHPVPCLGALAVVDGVQSSKEAANDR